MEVELTKTGLSQHFNTARQNTESFCQFMTVEDYVPQSVYFTSPPKWHLGHTTWFFEELILKVFVDSYQVFDPEFSFLFNSYYNTIGERTLRHERGSVTRPTVQQVYEYRKYVKEAIVSLLNTSTSEEIEELVTIGINHEEQHQELLITDFKYTLSLNPTHPVYDQKLNLVEKSIETDSGFIKINEGVYEIGHDGNGFAYDNELGQHKVYIQKTEIAKSLVTNGEYLEFIESGAYQDFKYWLDEGWTWVSENSIEKPLYWEKKGNEWYYFTLAGLKKINLHAPVSHISFYEANAYANWKKMRLPTEFEWEVASEFLNWGTRWEWTNSAYLPYPGFATAEGALGEYNGKFMINQMVLRGGSIATSTNHSRKTYRNFFHPQMQWQFAGIRLAKL